MLFKRILFKNTYLGFLFSIKGKFLILPWALKQCTIYLYGHKHNKNYCSPTRVLSVSSPHPISVMICQVVARHEKAHIWRLSVREPMLERMTNYSSFLELLVSQIRQRALLHINITTMCHPFVNTCGLFAGQMEPCSFCPQVYTYSLSPLGSPIQKSRFLTISLRLRHQLAQWKEDPSTNWEMVSLSSSLSLLR